MSLYIDNNVLQAEIDRRFELAGVDRHDSHHHDRHRHDLPARRLGAHRLAALVARFVGGRTTPAPKRARRGTPAGAGRPQHP